MRFRKNLFLYFIAMNITYAGTVSDLIDYQLYRDFAMNKGKFKVGAKNVVVERKDGTSKVINVPIPDFATTSETANGTLIDPNYIAGVKHTNGYQTVTYGYKTGHTYKLVDRNQHNSRDYHTPRLSKVVTDVAPTKYKQDDTLVQDWGKKYSMFARVGTGMQYVQDANGNKDYLAYAYQYYTGGIISSDMLYKGIWIDDREWNFNNSVDKSPLPIYIEAGDSGSPLWGFNNETQEWELVAFAYSISSGSSIYIPVIKEFMENVIKEDTLPDIKDVAANGEIVWNGVTTTDGNKGTGTITQGNQTWDYNGLKSDVDLANASNDELNSTKHVTFAGEGGTIKLADSINMGAGKLTFKNNYTLKGETGKETWVGAGIEVDKDKKVVWQVNGVKGDALHKIGEGTLHINATGKNEGALNVGDGTVILDQQADENGNKQAFEYIDIVSGRATVVLADDKQIDTSKINFGFRGGRLDVNSNEIAFGDINATDSGAMIVNHNKDKKATIDINTDNFKGNTSIFHGQFGEYDENRVNGEMDVNIGGSGDKTFAITGGSTLNGDFNLKGEGTTLILSGGRDLHAGEDIKKTTVNGDYYYSQFDFENINMSEGTELHGSVYSVINGNLNTEGNNKIVLGYVSDESKLVYDATQETKEQTATEVILNDETTENRFKEITTFYKGDINLQKDSDLKMGYTQIEGNITQDKSNSTISKTTLIGNLNLYNFSNSAVSNSTINGDINLSDSHLVLKDSNVVGTVAAAQGKLNLYSTVWTITGDSQVDTLLIGDNTQIHFNKNSSGKSSEEFSNLTVKSLDSANNTLAVNLNTDSSTGRADKLIIDKLAKSDEAVNMAINISDKAAIPNYGERVNIVKIGSTDSKINLGNNRVDTGAVKVELEITHNEDGSGSVDYKVPSLDGDKISKDNLGSTSNTMAAEFAARGELLRSQKRVLKDSMQNMDRDSFYGGAYYVGNYSESKYESNSFREYEQTIINHGFAYERERNIYSNWSNYEGLAFIYGKSNIEYGEGYSGDIESFSGHLYSKMVRDDGVYLKGDLNLSHLKEEINGRKFDTNVFGLGAGAGLKRDFLGVKLTTGLDMNLYYLPSVDYTLDFRNEKSQSVSVDDELVVELIPEIRLEKDLYYGNVKVTPYGALAYEFNDYLLNKGPELRTAGAKLATGLIERGGSITIGGATEYKNLGVDLEVKYLTGEYGAEKLTGTVKVKYRF